MLDLGGQTRPGGPPAGVVQVGEAPVRDDDVGQRVGRVVDLPEHGVVGVPQRHLQQTDAVAAIAHRRYHPPPALVVRVHVLALAPQDRVVDGALQIDRFLGVLQVTVGRRGQAQQPLLHEIDEQERHAVGPEALAQIVCDHADGLPGGADSAAVRSSPSSRFLPSMATSLRLSPLMPRVSSTSPAGLSRLAATSPSGRRPRAVDSVASRGARAPRAACG